MLGQAGKLLIFIDKWFWNIGAYWRIFGPTSLSSILRPCNHRFRGLHAPLNHSFALTLFLWLSGNRSSAMWLQLKKNRRWGRNLGEGRRSLIGHIPARAPSIVIGQERPAFVQNKNYYRNSRSRNRGKPSSQNAIKILHLRIIPFATTRLLNHKSSTLPHSHNLGSSSTPTAKHMLLPLIASSQPLWSSTILQWLKWIWASQKLKDLWIIQRSFSFPILPIRDFTIEKLLLLKREKRNYLK